MSTLIFTRESLVSLFRTAADALQSSTPASNPPSPQVPSLDYSVALETYLRDHSHELGNIATWCKRKFASEPTQAKAKSLLVYAQKQVDLVKAAPSPEPRF